MKLSTRNQLRGVVTSIDEGKVTAIVKVALDGGQQSVTSSITLEAARELGLKVGDPVVVLIKASEVGIGVE
jgi:molybdopterin-binding protein